MIFWGQEAASQEKGEATERPTSPYQEPEKTSQPSATGVGVLEIQRRDGSKDKIYYSTITPEEELQKSKEEKEKIEGSWEVLKNVIIDKRTK